MKYHIWTEGCQMNVADSQRVASALEQLGYQAAPRAEDADVIVLNTCVVRQSAEDKAYGRLTTLKPLKKQRPGLVINLMGCLVGVKNPQPLKDRFPFVDVFSPPSDPRPLVSFLTQGESQKLDQDETLQRFARMDEDLVLPEAERGSLISGFVPVVLGCSHACTFCIIPYRRGAERSRPAEAILAEVRSLAAQGVKEITFLGQIVDRYGKDLPDSPDLSGLLQRAHAIEGIERIRFLTSHPNWMTDRLLDTVAELPKVMPHIEVPVQAGDDEVLQRMRRGYTAEAYRRLVEKIRSRFQGRFPGVSNATDIIV
jgi:tRNA-2-methylthio-N6-dimethylallyladenosine synthase